MTGMHEIMAGVAAAAVVAGVAMGVAGAATGWSPSWAGRRILRPRLWGYGTLAGAVGMAAYLFLGPLSDSPFAHRPEAGVGLALWMAGLVAQMLSGRPGRTPEADSTKNAS
ncbi:MULTISPECIES: hypothetical protein [unclassified Streptomyces]|uniref:hypothetical protein n=1 Tax=unclassified Streptomyces TaxID=2593676 RepID=UPI003D8A53D4